MKRMILVILSVFAFVSFSRAEIIVEEPKYEVGGKTFQGYLVYDDAAAEKRPGVIVVHEWWGHNDYARKRARMLAELGYTALAVDMYGDGKVAEHPDDAAKFASEVRENAAAAKERFIAGMNLLKAHKSVDPEKIAAIGYCFGGATVLNMARQGVDLKGVVSFHGSLATDTPAQSGNVKAKVLACHGADDGFIPQEDIDAFIKEMTDASADFQFKSYKGAKHSFTNPDADAFAKKFGMDIAYNAAADQDSWSDMKDFLRAIFAE